MVYVCLTFLVLIFLNIYTSGASQRLFYQDKEAQMIEKCQNTASQIANLPIINTKTVTDLISQTENQKLTRMVVTDRNGIVIYDSFTVDAAMGEFALLPEIVEAMSGQGNNVFHWEYHDGAMESKAATPVVSSAASSAAYTSPSTTPTRAR